MKTTTASTHAPPQAALPAGLADDLARALAAALVQQYRQDEAVRNPEPGSGTAHSGEKEPTEG